MRHTLLPLYERLSLRKEYRIRVFIVLCFLLSISFLIGIVAMFPVFIKARSIETNAKYLAENIEGVVVDKITKQIQGNVFSSMTLLYSLDKHKNSPVISNLINEAVGARGQIRFTGFLANIVSTSTFNMNIQGIASSRNDLIDFKDRFESLTLGNKVELPVSELAKSSNIQFSLQLKRKLP